MQLYFWREAWRSFRTHRGLAVTSILSLAALLTLSGIFMLVDHNVGQALNAISTSASRRT